MLSNVGHTIQKMINNTPIGVTANDHTTEVVTNGGNVYLTGLIGGRPQCKFNELNANENVVGRVVQAAATEEKLYLLNANGAVFAYDFNSVDCPIIREVYSPPICGSGDKAVKIESGAKHVLILTENHKVWGAGDNSQYQIVPQGQCKYETAVEVIVTDTNVHDNDSCTAFTGIYNELKCPVIPQKESNCGAITCVRDDQKDVLLGYMNITGVDIIPDDITGIFSVPIFGDISYNGFLCVDNNNTASGVVPYTITKLYIKCGCFVSKFTDRNAEPCLIKEFNTSSTAQIMLFEASNYEHPSTCNSDPVVQPIRGFSQVKGKCGSCAFVNIDLNGVVVPLPTVAYNAATRSLVLTGATITNLTLLCIGAFNGLVTEYDTSLALDFDIKLACNNSCAPVRNITVLPQPCWTAIYANSFTSVLVDNCNRMYVLGSIHNIRSNKKLLRCDGLQELLNSTGATISFPADQLNCAGNGTIRNSNCPCNYCVNKDRKFKTDLSKFGISLNIPNGDGCNPNQMNVCDFLGKLKKCNEARGCDPTCEPCDGYIYLNVAGDIRCPSEVAVANKIGSVTLFNKKSVCKLDSQGIPDIVTISADLNTIVEYDLNKYCIDATDVQLDKIVKLEFCNDGPNVNVYLDIDQPGGVKFTADLKNYNVEFTVNASTKNHQFILNYGSILDPVELTNLKYALSLDPWYPCPQYKNPFNTKLTNTYLRGGDHVRFIVTNPKNIRQAVTADIPTVFRLNRRILDVAVGYNNLSVLVGGLACPNDVFAIGYNCRGELGIGSNETIVCWRQLNRCNFDCQVTRLFAGTFATFYITQSYNTYGAGQWKSFVNSNTPERVKSICKTWKIKEIVVTKSHIVLLGSDGSIFGLGDTSFGQLGNCNTAYVCEPSPISFFYKLNSQAGRQLRNGLDGCDGGFRPFCPPNPFNFCGFPFEGNCNANNCDGNYKNKNNKCSYNPNGRVSNY